MSTRLKLLRIGPCPVWLLRYEFFRVYKLLPLFYKGVCKSHPSSVQTDFWGQCSQKKKESYEDGGMPGSLWYTKGSVHLCPSLAFTVITKPFKLHMDSSTMGLGAVLYQEQDGNNQVTWYASQALSKSESLYPHHKLKFLALKWTVTKSFQEHLYGNTFTVYSENIPLTYVLTVAKLDATGHQWVTKLAKFNSVIHYTLENLMLMLTHCPKFLGIRTLKWTLLGPFPRPQWMALMP